MRRSITVIAVPLLLAGAVLAGSSALAARGPDVEVIGHRGSSGVAPENTRASIRLALEQGADVVENDIQRTRDGRLVVVHDLTLERTTDVETVFPDRAPWNVGDFTLAEIKRLDAGSWFAREFSGQRVLTLQEWVRAVGDAQMLLEAKDPQLYPGIEHDIDAALRAMPEFRRALRQDRVTMQAGNEEWLRAYHAIAPDVPIGLIWYDRPTDEQLVAASSWVDRANPALGNMDEAMVDRIHELGMETWVWTVNGGRDMYRAIEWEVDGIITDYPQVLDGVLRG